MRACIGSAAASTGLRATQGTAVFFGFHRTVFTHAARTFPKDANRAVLTWLQDFVDAAFGRACADSLGHFNVADRIAVAVVGALNPVDSAGFFEWAGPGPFVTKTAE